MSGTPNMVVVVSLPSPVPDPPSTLACSALRASRSICSGLEHADAPTPCCTSPPYIPKDAHEMISEYIPMLSIRAGLGFREHLSAKRLD
jgi:hypothetical protein